MKDLNIVSSQTIWIATLIFYLLTTILDFATTDCLCFLKLETSKPTTNRSTIFDILAINQQEACPLSRVKIPIQRWSLLQAIIMWIMEHLFVCQRIVMAAPSSYVLLAPDKPASAQQMPCSAMMVLLICYAETKTIKERTLDFKTSIKQS